MLDTLKNLLSHLPDFNRPEDLPAPISVTVSCSKITFIIHPDPDTVLVGICPNTDSCKVMGETVIYKEDLEQAWPLTAASKVDRSIQVVLNDSVRVGSQSPVLWSSLPFRQEMVRFFTRGAFSTKFHDDGIVELNRVEGTEFSLYDLYNFDLSLLPEYPVNSIDDFLSSDDFDDFIDEIDDDTESM